MKTQIATSPLPRLRAHPVTTRPGAGLETLPSDPLARDRFDWCYGPRNVETYGSLVLERAVLAARSTAAKEQVEEGPSEEYHFDGLPSAANFPLAFRKEWKDRFGLRPLEYFRKLFDTPRVGLGGGAVVARMDDAGVTRGLELRCELVHPASGQPIGLMTQDFDFSRDEAPRLHIPRLQLREESQTRGIAGELLANSVALCDEMGIHEMTVDAGRGIVGYGWARYGFVPGSGADTERVFAAVRERLGEVGLPEEAVDTVWKMLSGNNAKAIWAVSDMSGETATLRGSKTSLGRVLLEGISWRGCLDLLDPESRARFDQCVKGERLAASEETAA